MDRSKHQFFTDIKKTTVVSKLGTLQSHFLRISGDMLQGADPIGFPIIRALDTSSPKRDMTMHYIAIRNLFERINLG